MPTSGSITRRKAARTAPSVGITVVCPGIMDTSYDGSIILFSRYHRVPGLAITWIPLHNHQCSSQPGNSRCGRSPAPISSRCFLFRITYIHLYLLLNPLALADDSQPGLL